MSASPAELVEWLDSVLGPAPIELDRAAGAMLRLCRDHAGALRTARSAQLDRALGPAAATLSSWLGEHVAGDWLLARKLAPAVADVWRLAHAEIAPAPARAVVARTFAEALDDALGHRFVSIFRRRGEWRVLPGEPFPVVQPDLRRLFAHTALTTLPDRRETPIDRTRRLALAPAADGIEVAVDLSAAAAVAAPPADATIAAALPIAAPTRELDWTTTRGHRPVFHDVRPVAPTDVAARVEELASDACARGASVLVFPELSIDDVALDRLRAVLDAAPSRPALVVAGSRHVRVGTGPLRNVATLISDGGEITHAKFNPYFAGEQLEDIALVPAEVRAHGLVDDAGRLTFALVMVVCKDFLAPGAQHALETLRPTLVVVPAWSQKTSVFESDAIGLTGKTQSIVLIANQADTPALGDEDPAVLILTRPVPALSPVIVRRGEVSPPELIVATLAGEW